MTHDRLSEEAFDPGLTSAFTILRQELSIPREEGPVSRPRAADDFATIRARMEELRHERARSVAGEDARPAKTASGRGETDSERRRRERIEGFPPPWVPTIFVKKPRP
jgi:hypothetical protein